MKTHTIRDVKYWYDCVWWAARYDADGNQIGDAVHAASRDGIMREIDACLPARLPTTPSEDWD